MKYTKEQIAALNYFRTAYLNTGCEVEEAEEHAEFMLRQCGGDADRLYFEAERYRDM